MGIFGCYSLDLYCDSELHDSARRPHDSAQVTGGTEDECLATAMANGWMVDRRGLGPKGRELGSGRAVCPVCLAKQQMCGTLDKGDQPLGVLAIEPKANAMDVFTKPPSTWPDPMWYSMPHDLPTPAERAELEGRG